MDSYTSYPDITEIMLESALTLYHMIPTFNNPEKESFWKYVGKGENAGYLFPQCFQPY